MTSSATAALLLPPPLKLPSTPTALTTFLPRNNPPTNKPTTGIRILSAAASPSTRTPRFRPLDLHATKHNRLRFVRKLTTLLLSKPRHFLPLRVLSRCRRYLNPTRPLLHMILRYPAVFRLFHAPSASSPSSLSLLCVGLTPAAAALSEQEAELKSRIAETLAVKLQKLLMMSEHRRLLLSKLVHIAPDLGLPADFRSRVCGRHPDQFRTVNTSYGWTLELVKWDEAVAVVVPEVAQCLRPKDRPIIDRPPKFKQLRLRKGLNLKRRHRDYLFRFQELPEVSPYSSYVDALDEGLAEKRACSVVREILAMTVERRTLVDHLTHFRKEMGLPNKLRGMLVRHPEMFYISLKGKRDSVFLVEGYDDKGKLVDKDELVEANERLVELVKEGKRMRRERRRDTGYGDGYDDEEEEEEYGSGWIDDSDDNEGDLKDLFETGIDGGWEEFNNLDNVDLGIEENGQEIKALEFWTVNSGGGGGQEDELEVW